MAGFFRELLGLMECDDMPADILNKKKLDLEPVGKLDKYDVEALRKELEEDEKNRRNNNG